MRFLASLFFFTVSLFSFDYHLKPYKITDNVDCFFGLSSTADKTNGGNTVNSCYITTNDGFIVIDSGPTYSYARQAYQVMQNKKQLPVKYVISTSTQEVHLLGNEFYKERGAILIGPKAYDSSSEIKLSANVTNATFVNTRLVPLNKKVDSNYNITLGGIDIEIKKAIKNSDKYLVVTVPSLNIAFVGDMLSHNSIPILSLDRSLLDWIDSLKKIESGSWSRIVSAHGIRIKSSAINSTKNYLEKLKKELTNNIKKRVEKTKAIENTKMNSFKEERLYEEWHKKNVTLAYNQLIKIVKPNPIPIASLPVSNQIKETPKKIIKKKEVKVKKAEIKKPKVKEKKVKKIAKVKKHKTKKRKIKKRKREKIPPIITYYSYETAKYYAKREKKIILLKVRSNHCPFCDELDSVMQGSRSIRKIVNRNFKMIYLNVSMGKLPLGIKVRKLPSLVLIRPDKERVTMTITDFKSVGELLNMLKSGVNKGRAGGYLK